MKKQTVITLFIACLGGIFLGGCKGKLEEVHLQNEQGQYKVLLAGVESMAKRQVREGFIERYREYCDIRVVNLKQARNFNVDEYDLVLLIDAKQAGMMFNGFLKKYVNNLQKSDKVVVVITAGDPDAAYAFTNGIDAITGATDKPERVQALTDRIFERADRILIKKDGSVTEEGGELK